MKTLTSFIALLLVANITFAGVRVPMGSPNTSTPVVATADNQSSNKTGGTTLRVNNKNKQHFKFTPKQLWAVNGKMPPKIVLQFLENPTKENAERYLAWQQERASKLDKAIAMLESLEKERFLKKINTQNVNNTTIVMYFSPTCPHCIRELKTLKRIKSSYPNIGLQLIPISNRFLAQVKLQEIGLGKYLKIASVSPAITGVPYIILVNSKTGKVKKVFTGETGYETLLEAM